MRSSAIGVPAASAMRLIATLAAVVVSASPVGAQQCTGNIQIGCTNAGAVCSPVAFGVGPTGRCTTPAGLPPGERECVCIGAPALNLTGTWTANDGGVYSVRQAGKQIWWVGLSVQTPAGVGDLHRGLAFTNVFHGQLSGTTISGEWADVPRGRTLNAGTLTLTVSNTQITRQAQTGGFGASVWSRASSPPPSTDVFTLFDEVMKNQNEWRDHSLLDNLKPAKAKPVTVFGRIVAAPSDPDPMHVNYPATASRSYNDFICLDDNDSPPDGDIDFNIEVDRPALDGQLGFWSEGWETDHGVTASNFRNKLDVHNQLHIESIMYGGTTECGDDDATSLLLPGWQQPGALGVLLNGTPIAGQMDLTQRDASSSRVNAILGRKLEFGALVRVTGNLVLDCGHGFLHNCDEDVASTQNQEIHPVWALDFVQDFRRPRPLAVLTGVWSADDAGTYYVRQVNDTVWWLGLSTDEGRTFANVFRGTLQNGQLTGDWADLPLGQASSSGSIAISAGGPSSTAWNRISETGGFGGGSWRKLYDVGGRIVVVFEDAVAGGPTWPVVKEPFEFTVAGKRYQAMPSASHAARTPNGRTTARVALATKVSVDLPNSGMLRVQARFAGYRARWTIPAGELKPGEYTQPMTTPRAGPRAAAEADQGEVTDRDALVRPERQATPLPPITLHYRIEVAPAADSPRPPNSPTQ
jgi:hypothetical protein